jgi:hypothetical protein
MMREITPLIDLVSEVGPTPKGVDQIDYIIASLPGNELARSARNSTFSYEGLVEIDNSDPTFVDRFNAVPHPEKSLADDILSRQNKLAGSRRRLATYASVLAIGAGGFFAGYKMDEQVQHSVFGNPPHAVEQVQPGGNQEEIQDGAIFGGISGILAGFVVYTTSLFQSGRLARRPAQKIVDKTLLSKL